MRGPVVPQVVIKRTLYNLHACAVLPGEVCEHEILPSGYCCAWPLTDIIDLCRAQQQDQVFMHGPVVPHVAIERILYTLHARVVILGEVYNHKIL